VTWRNFYFRLYPGAIGDPQVADFLGHLLRCLPGKLSVIWEGLPGYAPELNPVEYLWGYWKRHELPHFCPRATSASPAIMLAARSGACAGGPPW
jgi:hypothetical protein